MKKKRTEEPRTTLLYLGGPGRSAGVEYEYNFLNSFYFLSPGDELHV
ncbi:hypothetical protein [uncultured Methanospirillum sp.]|nr:hypothetical protein [uncultured Methanospirillum sp.]